MTAIRILHVDDEPDIREVVGLSLGLNPDFAVRPCASGAEAVTAAANWAPFLILLDVMMPGMDGPTTLTHLRKDPRCVDIPVLFMTARAQAREVAYFISLGAQGVISKPFDPMTLASQVSGHLQALRMEALRSLFKLRAKSDAALLTPFQSSDGFRPDDLIRMRQLAHGLAGAAGLFGFEGISRDAAALEEAVRARQLETGPQIDVSRALASLLLDLEGTENGPSPAFA